MEQVTDCSARNDKSGTEAAPRIWVLTGNKTGDNAQVLRAVTATGLAYEVRNIVLKPHFDRVKPRVYPSLHHVDRARSSALLAPWPDVVVAIGRRMSLVALWIRQQSLDRCRIALFNAPKSRTARFDLAVVPCYYKMAERPEVCRIGLPLIAADPAALADAQRSFSASLGAMPKPLHVLLLGGATGQMGFSSQFASTVLTRMQESFAASGSIFVSTSRDAFRSCRGNRAAPAGAGPSHAAGGRVGPTIPIWGCSPMGIRLPSPATVFLCSRKWQTWQTACHRRAAGAVSRGEWGRGPGLFAAAAPPPLLWRTTGARLSAFFRSAARWRPCGSPWRGAASATGSATRRYRACRPATDQARLRIVQHSSLPQPALRNRTGVSP